MNRKAINMDDIIRFSEEYERNNFVDEELFEEESKEKKFSYDYAINLEEERFNDELYYTEDSCDDNDEEELILNLVNSDENYDTDFYGNNQRVKHDTDFYEKDQREDYDTDFYGNNQRVDYDTDFYEKDQREDYNADFYGNHQRVDYDTDFYGNNQIVSSNTDFYEKDQRANYDTDFYEDDRGTKHNRDFYENNQRADYNADSLETSESDPYYTEYNHDCGCSNKDTSDLLYGYEEEIEQHDECKSEEDNCRGVYEQGYSDGFRAGYERAKQQVIDYINKRKKKNKRIKHRCRCCCRHS